MDNVVDILKLSVEKEHMRAAIYREAAAATTNPLAQATFEALARDEEKHEAYLKAYYDKQVAEAGWPAVDEIMDDEDSLDVVEQIFKYANAMIEKAGESSADLKAVYDAAIAAEIESVHLYTDAMNHSSDPNAIAFFQVLVDVEKMHAKLLAETQDYLDDTSKWYFDAEHWGVEG
jgi:rubrerythrin